MKKSTLIDKFLDLLSSRSALREINNNFIDADIMRDSFILISLLLKYFFISL